MARALVKPGGRIAYVTCSLLAEENTDQVAWLLAAAPELSLIDPAKRWTEVFGCDMPSSADGRTDTLLLSPRSHGTDGFFIALFAKAA